MQNLQDTKNDIEIFKAIIGRYAVKPENEFHLEDP